MNLPSLFSIIFVDFSFVDSTKFIFTVIVLNHFERKYTIQLWVTGALHLSISIWMWSFRIFYPNLLIRENSFNFLFSSILQKSTENSSIVDSTKSAFILSLFWSKQFTSSLIVTFLLFCCWCSKLCIQSNSVILFGKGNIVVVINYQYLLRFGDLSLVIQNKVFFKIGFFL